MIDLQGSQRLGLSITFSDDNSFRRITKHIADGYRVVEDLFRGVTRVLIVSFKGSWFKSRPSFLILSSRFSFLFSLLYRRSGCVKHWLKGWGLLVIRGGMVAGFQALPENSGAFLTVRYKNSKKLYSNFQNEKFPLKYLQQVLLQVNDSYLYYFLQSMSLCTWMTHAFVS